MFLFFAALGLLGGTLALPLALEGEDKDYTEVDVDSEPSGEETESGIVLDDNNSAGDPHTETTGIIDGNNSEPDSKSSGEIEISPEETERIPNLGIHDQENDVPTRVVGSDHDDILSGVNVHIDVASGIVKLQGDSNEILEGRSGNDLLVLGEGDTAEGGEGADEFVVDGEISGSKIPKISDFNVGEDTVVISLPTPEDVLAKSFPERPEFEGDVDITFEDGKTQILVNGKKVCELNGIQNLDSSNFQINYDYHASIPTDFDENYGYV